MTKLQYLVGIILVIPSFLMGMQPGQPMDWSSQARDWVSSYVVSPDGALAITPADLQLVLNLLYLSYLRSQTTLLAQEQAIQSLQNTWQATQNIIQTRRNPSKETPYPHVKESIERNQSQLETLHAQHLHIGTIYATALELIINGSIISNSRLHDGIQAIRQAARRAIAHALTDVRSHLNAILNMRSSTVKKQIKKIINHVDDYIQSQTSTRSFKIADFIWGLMPEFTLKSFVKADTLTITLSDKWWTAQIQLLKLSNIIWKTLETARTQLYLDYYKAVYIAAQQCAVRPQFLTLMFDEQGILTVENRIQSLPDPATLSIQN